MQPRMVGRDGLLEAIIEALSATPCGCVLTGELGTGKTRLAQEVTRSLSERGWVVRSAVASEASRPIPFGAVAHLLPRLPAADLLQMLENVRRGLLDQAGGAPLLLWVDDAHRLDRHSLALLHRFAVAEDASVLLTIRSGEPVDPTVTDIWKDGYAVRIDVPSLDRPAHDEMVAEVLGGPVSQELLSLVWKRTRGNPLFVREVLAAGRESGVLRRHDETWRSDGQLMSSDRLAEILGTRLDSLSSGAEHALDLLALGTPLLRSTLLRRTAPEALDELERRGFVTVDHEQVVPSHPAYAEAVAHQMPGEQRRERLRELATLALEEPQPRPGDALRTALWLLDAGDPVPPPLAERAATEALARGDAVLAERLVGAAIGTDHGVDGRLLLGRALSMQHREGEAREVLATARERASSTTDRTRATLALAHHLVWIERDVLGGIRLVEEELAQVEDAAARTELLADRAIHEALLGRAESTVEMAQQVIDHPSASDRALLSALVQSTLARCILGRFDGLARDLDRGAALARHLVDEAPLASDQLAITGLMHVSFVDARAAVAVADRHLAFARSHQRPISLWMFMAGWARIAPGQVREAITTIERALDHLALFDPFGNLPMAHGALAVACGMAADAARAREALAAAGPPDQMEARTRVWFDRGAAWEAAGRGDVATAVELALAGGQRAIAGSLVTWGASALFDAVRFGAPQRVVNELADVARASDAPILALLAATAAAAADRDADRLADLVVELVDGGLLLPAAEMLTTAAMVDGTDPVVARRRAVRARTLLTLCAGAATPGLRDLEDPLTKRERVVASLAATGATSRAIAEGLYLSERTVDNHLSHVYRKLGLDGRGGLEPLLGLPEDDLSTSSPGVE